mmetsp:Transcript_31519/g.27908  ORF Transcript_31519/g.27908 Transcript_31519/m.27908 type:complete len:141 (+) Transcript_31519:1843-2265(+)
MSHFLKFRIIDTGCGILQKDTNKLFTMFGMINQNNRQINKNGTGLGLTICKKLTETLGGKIKLKSQKNIGTEVVFTVKNYMKNEVPLNGNLKQLKSFVVKDDDNRLEYCPYSVDKEYLEHKPHVIKKFESNTSCFNIISI